MACDHLITSLRRLLNFSWFFGHHGPVTGKAAFPGWDGKFVISAVEDGNQ